MVFSIVPTSNFPSEFYAIITSLLIIIIFLIELRILVKQSFSGEKQDKGTLYLILAGIFVPIIFTIIFAYLGFGVINTSISYLGLILLFGGFFLRQCAIFTLGRYFVPIIAKQKSQAIIISGPYKYLRHPSYTGLLLEVSGFSLVLSNIFGFIIAIILLAPALLYRIKKEEDFLAKNLNGYGKYMEKTKKLVPYVY